MSRDVFPQRINFIQKLVGYGIHTTVAASLEALIARDVLYDLITNDLSAAIAGAPRHVREQIMHMSAREVLAQPLSFWVSPERVQADADARRLQRAMQHTAEGRDVELADTDYVCAACGSRKVLTNTRQTRSGDEGARTIRWCDNCGGERIRFCPRS